MALLKSARRVQTSDPRYSTLPEQPEKYSEANYRKLIFSLKRRSAVLVSQESDIDFWKLRLCCAERCRRIFSEPNEANSFLMAAVCFFFFFLPPSFPANLRIYTKYTSCFSEWDVFQQMTRSVIAKHPRGWKGGGEGEGSTLKGTCSSWVEKDDKGRKKKRSLL